MKISKLFHWLYATLMFLPLLVAPIFGIYSHRHTIDSYSIEAPNYERVNFNQLVNGDSIPPYTFNNGYFDILDHDSTLYPNFGNFDIKANNTYLLSIRTNQFVVDGNNSFYLNIGSTYGYIDFIDSTGLKQKILTPTSSDFTDVKISSTIPSHNYGNVSIQLFNLTQMFGAGNEPTLQEFNTLFTDDYYYYTLSKPLLIQNGTQVYNDSDIGSQFVYTIYGTLTNYFDFSKVFGLNQLGEYMYLNWFYGNSYIGFSCFFLLLTYWLIISLCWLVFDLLMYVPNLAHRWLDKGALE